MARVVPCHSTTSPRVSHALSMYQDRSRGRSRGMRESCTTVFRFALHPTQCHCSSDDRSGLAPDHSCNGVSQMLQFLHELRGQQGWERKNLPRLMEVLSSLFLLFRHILPTNVSPLLGFIFRNPIRFDRRGDGSLDERSANNGERKS